jgi:hypothetical protein
MGVRLDGNIVRLEGRCNVEDAEPLFGWLQEDPVRTVNIAEAEHLHAAVVQVLMVLRPAMSGSSRDAFIRDWIAPLVQPSGSSNALVERA